MSLALAAGMFSALPVAHGMPTLDPAAPHTGGTPDATAVIDANDPNKMNVTGSRTNNVVDWTDFSIAKGETVAFQNVGEQAANYMNIVTGHATSNIEGTMTNNGDIYLINPNGVIFGANAQVNVGNLYVSTREASQVAIDTFRGTNADPVNDVGTILSAVTMDNALKSDVVNLIDQSGYVKADTVVMEGNNIRFLNTSSVGTKESTVTENAGKYTVSAHPEATNIILRSDTDGYIHVGDTNSATGKYTAQTMAQGAATGVNYKVVRDVDGLNAINSNLSGNYMLANDITNAGNVQIGTGVYDEDGSGMPVIGSGSHAFSGNFDGMFFTVSGLSQSDSESTAKYLGLFGYVNNARIENLGIAEARLKGYAVGGLVGYAHGSSLLNVWNAGRTDGALSVGWDTTGVLATDAFCTGGIAGYMGSSLLSNAYNTSHVAGAGLAGFLNNSTIQNAYNTGKLETDDGLLYGVFNSRVDGDHSKVIDTYTASKKFHNEQLGQEIFSNNLGIDVINNNNCYIIVTDSQYKDKSDTIHTANMLTAGTYAFGSISSEGGSNSAWRIYEGYSLPLLTAFFKGTVATDYSYNTIAADSSTATESSSAAYDFSQFKTDYSTTPVTYSTLPSKTYEAAAVGPTSVKYYGMNADGTGITTSDNKDAKTFALFYGGQQGYDLYGNNFTINKRNIKIGVNNGAANKVYDGKSQNIVSGEGLLGTIVNADDEDLPGVIDEDTVELGGTVTYTYKDATTGNADKNVGAKKVSITTTGLTLTGASAANYNADFSAPDEDVDAKITKRTIQVGLYNTSGITKTYDGTATVTNENKGERPHGFVGAENVDTSTLTNVDGDADWLSSQGLTIADILSDDHVGFDTSKITSRYVKADKTTDAVNVADAKKVAYEGIALTGDASVLANYQLSNGGTGTVYADGSITKRNILSTSLGYDSSGSSAITKVYDGLETMSGGAVQDVTVGNQVAKGTTSTHTGLITTDATAVQFATTGTATFYESIGMTPTANATNYKGDGTGAQKVKYNVALKETNAITANYTVDGNALNTTTTYGVVGTGTITKRAITVELVKNSDLDKTYNGTADLDAGTAANYKNGSISISGGATGNLRYAQGSETIATTDTDVNISITNAAYADQNVAYDGSGNVTDKNITYTVAFNDADAAYNYTLNTVASTTEPASTTLAATGEISPKELSLSFGSANKTYDGDALVHTIPTVTINNLVTGDSADDVFDSSKVAGRYGSDATGTFVTSANVGNYTTEAATAGAKVLYTGLKNNDGTYKDIKTAIKDTIKGKNYTISNTVYGKGIISKKTIRTTDLDTATSVKSGYTPLTKVYDGSATDSSTAVTGLSWSDYLVWNDDQTVFAPTDRDNLTITIAEAIYTNKNVNDPESPQAVSLKYNIKGTAAANYEFVGDTVTTNADGSKTIAYTKSGYTGTITPRTVTVTMKDGVTSPTKIYDGTTTVKATGVTTTAGVSTLDNGTWSNWFQLANVVDSEDLQLANGITAAYASKDVAYNNTGAVTTQAVNYGHVALADGTSALASNYTLVNNIQGVGTINKRNVTLSDYGVATATKTYDTDAVVKAYALSFDNGNDTTDWAVLATDGITKNADGTVNTNGLVSYGLTGTYLPTGSQTEGQGKDVLRDSTNRATILEKDVEYTGTALTNLYGGNYNVTLADGGTYNSTTGKLTVTDGGKINPAEIDLTGAGVNDGISRAYNRLNTITRDDAINHITGVSANNLAMLDVSGTFTEGANVKRDAQGNVIAQPIALTITMLNTPDALNYDLKGGVGSKDISGTGKITPVTVSVSLNQPTVEKVYDGGKELKANGEVIEADVVKGWFSVSGIGDETLSVANVTGKYADENAGDTKTINYTGITLGDGSGTNAGLASNYQLSSTTKTGTGKITPKSIAFAITVADGAYKKDYDGDTGLDGKLNGADTTNSTTLTGTVTAWWNGARATGDTTTFGNAFETDAGGKLVGYYGVWNPTTKTFTENPNVWADKANNKKTSDVYYGLTLKGDAAQNYVITGGTKGATINVNNTTIQDTVYFQDAMKGKGEIKQLSISMGKVKNEWGTFEKVYDGSTSVEGYLVSGAATPTKEQQLTIYFDRDDSGGYSAGDVIIPYRVNAANYEDANAGNGKNIAYTGFSFNDSDLNNFIIPAADLRDKYADGKAATKTTGNIARRLLNVTPGTNNVKIYDGSEVLVAAGTAYTASMTDATNPNATGLVVGHDNVSVTYEANFDNKNASVDPDAAATDPGWTAKNVTYTYTLANGGDSANYTLVSNPANDAAARTTTKNTTGAIKKREVQVVFKDGVDSTKFDKTYDESGSLVGNNGKLLTDGLTTRTLDDAAATGILTLTGVVNGDKVHLDTTDENKPTAAYYYGNGTKNENGDTNYKLAVTTQDVYVQNLNLAGDDSGNYKLTTTKLTGKGDIRRKQVTAELRNRTVTKVYDGTNSVSAPFLETNIKATGVIDGTTTSDGVEIDNDKLQLGFVEPVIYYDKDNPTATYNGDAREAGGLGVKYYLKVDNKNYELIRQRLDADANGKITKRVLTEKTGDDLRIEKTYDGTTALGDASSVTTGLFSNVLGKDKATLLNVTGGNYTNPNTGAAADSVQGAAQNVTVNYQLTEAGHKNYKLNAGDTTDEGSYTGDGGYINRAQLTLTPNNVTYNAGDNIPTDGYAGSVSGFQNGETLANGYSYAFRRDGNTSTTPGSYSLVGYVNGPNGAVAPAVDGLIYYNYPADNTGNYYFVTAPNQALHVEAKADVADAVHRDTIADKKFIPDDYSYNRMSQDEDLTRLKRESQATVQYTEKGVNTDESSQGGLLASMDIQGAGSVVNLNGAVIQTSAVPEKPEEIAAEAALPISETSESDFSSIDVENTDEADGSQSMLEVLTNASNKAENRGTSIVINTMDEDEEDAEEEKSRRALIVDRSNIGIETLGDAVNLDQMIG